MSKKIDRLNQVCMLCQVTLIYRPPTTPRGRDYFWQCPECGTETWPPGETAERQIRRSMGGGMKAKHKGGGGKSGRKRKQRKPGDKWVPWWQKGRG